ncbi:MAG: DEAD/DEAH box helicase family protein, partial [Longimicrobiales bacterium]|nr:DEAD/DEAH box helicase family protein [Longimicrobiales bacterium]
MPEFQIEAPYEPKGDQPQAIRELSEGLERGDRRQVLLGATGTGKTLTMAHVIRNHGRPTLVMSHNKTLAAQLYGELKSLFPKNAVEYFISYYDYYQPEAYVPATDTYIEKDASINEDIEKLRLRATSSLIERDDVIVVASVSAIYGLGNPIEYRALMLEVEVGEEKGRREILKGLVDIQYKRNDYVFERGTFRVRGDTIEIFPAYDEQGIRIELWGDEVERISRFDPVTGETITNLESTAVYPASHYVMRRKTIEEAIPEIRKELAEQVGRFEMEDRLLEAQRIESRTNFDLEMMQEIGTCPGIENYSRYTSGRAPGERPACLLDYFPEDYVLICDESHVTVP